MAESLVQSQRGNALECRGSPAGRAPCRDVPTLLVYDQTTDRSMLAIDVLPVNAIAI